MGERKKMMMIRWSLRPEGTLHNAHAGDMIDGMGCVRLRHVSLSHGLLSGGDILIVPHSFCHAFDSLVS